MTKLGEPLQFPDGVRFARPGEVPGCSDEDIRKLADAEILTGFVLRRIEGKPYSAQIEANVHASKIWQAVLELADVLLPQVTAPIIGWKDNEPTFGRYTHRSEAIACFTPFIESLQHDGFIEFGLIFQFNGVTEEIFVKPAKYIQLWTNRPEVAVSKLRELGLHQADRLHFLDEYPRITETPPSLPRTHQVVSAITTSFETLSEVPCPI